MNNIDVKDIAYKLCSEFIAIINLEDFEKLDQKFGISLVVWNEIKENVLRYYFQNTNFKLFISYDFFEIFDYEDGDYGIEAHLNDQNGQWTELTLRADLIRQADDQYQLDYRLIEVM